ncbi:MULTISPECIES: hypothetical protein [Clostridium]|uniref:DUF4834 domain-containing protein n=1 Tax=Clostridium cibarium TaxID=2762247 RepID=A0ABR8PVJ3_9CLOT|nr:MULTISPECIES: hypothetical protein [Clostridium]MBD7912184.1 hypothetical protein [Clostridium cibarium]
MNKIDFKPILYILIGVLAIGLFFKVLPYLLIGGFVIYVVLKVYGFFKSKSIKNSNKSASYTYDTNTQSYAEDDVDTSEAIDVDYKDV